MKLFTGEIRLKPLQKILEAAGNRKEKKIDIYLISRLFEGYRNATTWVLLYYIQKETNYQKKIKCV